jgi:creatinine amidohydrolase
MTDEVRLDRLRPAAIEAALARAPIAWVPLGALEYHAPHLPNGTDGLTGQGLRGGAAQRRGGVGLPGW